MDYDVSLVLFLQSYPALAFLMKFLSHLGTKEFFLLLLPAVYWCGNAALGFRLGLILTASYGINAICKRSRCWRSNSSGVRAGICDESSSE